MTFSPGEGGCYLACILFLWYSLHTTLREIKQRNKQTKKGEKRQENLIPKIQGGGGGLQELERSPPILFADPLIISICTCSIIRGG
jgi:hypothetical protein